MAHDCFERDSKGGSNFLTAFSVGDQCEHLKFTRCEVIAAACAVSGEGGPTRRCVRDTIRRTIST